MMYEHGAPLFTITFFYKWKTWENRKCKPFYGCLFIIHSLDFKRHIKKYLFSKCGKWTKKEKMKKKKKKKTKKKKRKKKKEKRKKSPFPQFEINEVPAVKVLSMKWKRWIFKRHFFILLCFPHVKKYELIHILPQCFNIWEKKHFEIEQYIFFDFLTCNSKNYYSSFETFVDLKIYTLDSLKIKATLLFLIQKAQRAF